MPSGRTHDSITLWSLPLVAGIVFERTKSSSLTLIVAGGYLFSGLMFGPDLDIYSRQYRRWGPLRWIWSPYRRLLRHRSFWSHGLIVGTFIRVIYLLAWLNILAILAVLVSTIALQAMGRIEQWQPMTQQWVETGWEVVRRSFQDHATEWMALGVGLELGAFSHACSDWVSSAYKRRVKQRAKKFNYPMDHSDADDDLEADEDDSLDWQLYDPLDLSRSDLSPQPRTYHISVSSAPSDRREPQLPSFVQQELPYPYSDWSSTGINDNQDSLIASDRSANHTSNPPLLKPVEQEPQLPPFVRPKHPPQA